MYPNDLYNREPQGNQYDEVKSDDKPKRKKEPEYPTELEWEARQSENRHAPIDTSHFTEMTLDDVADVLSLTIKDDDSNKKVVFLGMLSAFTDKSQLNVSLNAPSSTGKTYIVKEVASLFPEQDVIGIHAATPTSFFYEIDYIDKELKIRYKDVRRKIVIFYELPDPSLQAKLRPLLSHDAKEIVHKQTNKNKGRNSTDTVVLRGHAAFLFCSANMRLDEQEATRSILLSPQVTEAKLAQGIHLRAMRGADMDAFDDLLESNPKRIALKERILAIRDEFIGDVIIENPEEVERRFLKRVGTLKPRHQRDIDHLYQIIRSITLLNIWFRRRASDYAPVASESDIDYAFQLFDGLFESQNLNVPPAVLGFYNKYIKPAYIKKGETNKYRPAVVESMQHKKLGLTAEEISIYYMSMEHTTLNNETLRKNILPQLVGSGLVTWEKPDSDSADKRSRHIFPQIFTEEEEKQLKNIGIGGVSNEELDEELIQLGFTENSEVTPDVV